MNTSQENINLMLNLITNGETDKIKNLVDKGMDIHYQNDYFLYCSVFVKNEELQKYWIDIGLDPEMTKGRLAVAHPDELVYLQNYREEKALRDLANELDHNVLKTEKKSARIKI